MAAPCPSSAVPPGPPDDEADAALRLCTSIAEFTEFLRVGGGSSGDVFRAVWNSPDGCFEREVAIKVYKTYVEASSNSLRHKQDGERKARAALGEAHPGMVRLYTEFTDAIPDAIVAGLPSDEKAMVVGLRAASSKQEVKALFAVFEYHPRALDAWLKEQPCMIPREQFLRWALQLFEVQTALKAKGVLHRDIKLPNVLVTADGSLCLCDFAECEVLPCVMTPTELHKDSPGGNPSHLSPEVHEALKTIKKGPTKVATVDYSKQHVFETGVLLWEILLGHHPIANYAHQTQGVGSLKAIQDDDICFLPDRRCLEDAWYPHGLVALVRGMVAVDFHKRLTLSEAYERFQAMFDPILTEYHRVLVRISFESDSDTYDALLRRGALLQNAEARGVREEKRKVAELRYQLSQKELALTSLRANADQLKEKLEESEAKLTQERLGANELKLVVHQYQEKLKDAETLRLKQKNEHEDRETKLRSDAVKDQREAEAKLKAQADDARARADDAAAAHATAIAEVRGQRDQEKRRLEEELLQLADSKAKEVDELKRAHGRTCVEKDEKIGDLGRRIDVLKGDLLKAHRDHSETMRRTSEENSATITRLMEDNSNLREEKENFADRVALQRDELVQADVTRRGLERQLVDMTRLKHEGDREIKGLQAYAKAEADAAMEAAARMKDAHACELRERDAQQRMTAEDNQRVTAAVDAEWKAELECRRAEYEARLTARLQDEHESAQAAEEGELASHVDRLRRHVEVSTTKRARLAGEVQKAKELLDSANRKLEMARSVKLRLTAPYTKPTSCSTPRPSSTPVAASASSPSPVFQQSEDEPPSLSGGSIQVGMTAARGELWHLPSAVFTEARLLTDNGKTAQLQTTPVSVTAAALLPAPVVAGAAPASEPEASKARNSRQVPGPVSVPIHGWPDAGVSPFAPNSQQEAKAVSQTPAPRPTSSHDTAGDASVCASGPKRGHSGSGTHRRAAEALVTVSEVPTLMWQVAPAPPDLREAKPSLSSAAPPAPGPAPTTPAPIQTPGSWLRAVSKQSK